MGNIKQNITFEESGIDTDSSHAFMGNGSSPMFLNCMIGEDGNYGIRVNIKGNKIINYSEPLTLSNTYSTKGAYYNALQRKLYFFLYSQPFPDTSNPSPYDYIYDNRLLCYREDYGDIITIFKDPKNYLGISATHLLSDMKMIENWLFYNPGDSEPRMIDVDMAYNYTFYPAYDDTDPSFSATSGDTYTYRGGLFRANAAITAGQDPVNNATKWDRIGDSYQMNSTITGDEFYQAFLAIKTPPIDRIKTAYGSDPSASFNNVEGKVFRFAHRYQYFDNSYSVFSALSDVTLSSDTELYNGEKLNSGIFNNYITLSFSLYSAALVKNIEIAFQELGGDWKRVAIISRQDQSLLDTVSYTYNFYNNESYPALPLGVVDIIYDAVPRLASAQEIINKNVLCYGGVTEGFDNIDKDLIDVTLTPEIDSLFPQGTFEGVTKCDNEASNDITETSTLDTSYPDGGRMVYSTLINVDTWFAVASVAVGNVYKAVIDGKTAMRTLVAGDVDTDVHLAQAMAMTINNVGGVYAYVTTYMATVTVRIDTMDTPVRVNVSKIYAQAAVISSMAKQGGFKTASYHPFCIFYYDKALRRGNAQVTPDMVTYVPSINEYSPHVSTDPTDYKWNINWAVNHEPPAWARYWRWGYGGNRRASYFVQYIVSAIADGDTVVNNSIEVDISPLQTIRTTIESGWNSFPDSIIPAYVFAEGDRIRFMTKATTPASAGTLIGDAIEGIYDFEIIKFDDTTNKLYVRNFDIAGVGVGVNTLVEIYTPRLDTTVDTYYEYGDLMPIAFDTDGNLVHNGIDQNQMLTASPQPATGTFSYGDVYHILRTPSKPLSTSAGESINSAFHESMWWSDFYKSDDWSKGKIGLESSIGEVTLNIIRFSNVFLQNTAVNGITTFPVNNQKELNDIYGIIVAMVEVGDTLKVYQEKKASSIGIGRTEYMDASGKITVVGSDQILGVVRYSTTNYGTIFPESIVKNNRYVYGFDAYNGVVWRDAPNGLFPISGQFDGTKNGRMVTYFKNKAKAILTSGVDHCNVFQVWDEENKMLLITFKDIVDKTNNDTVVFHEPTDRWCTFTEMDYTPVGGFNDMLELTYEIVRGFELGIGYFFNEETRFAEFTLVTPVNSIFFAGKDDLTIESFDCTVQVDAQMDADVDGILLESPDITVVVTYVDIIVASNTWAYNEYGSGNKYPSVINSSASPATITAIPSWMEITNYGLAPLSVGDTITNGETYYFFPKVQNNGAVLTGNITITNAAGDSDSIACTQNAAILAPTVYVYQDGDNPSDITFTGLSGSMSAGGTALTLNFTPNHQDYTSGQTIQIYWRAEIDGGSSSSPQVISAIDEQVNSISITLPQIVYSGSTVHIMIKGVASTDITFTPDLSELTLTSYDCTIVSSAALASVTGLVFVWNDDTYAEGQPVTITAAGNPAGAEAGAMNVTITSKPSWLTIWHGDDMTGYALYDGWTISENETVTVFPSDSNTSGLPRSGYIVLTSAQGDTVTLTVSQPHYVAPAETGLTGTASLNTSSTNAGVTFTGSAYTSSGVKTVNFSFTIQNPMAIDGEYFDLYYRIYVNGFDVTDPSSGYLSAQNYSNGGVGLVTNTLLATDVVTLLFSIYSF